ncbi:MAG: hypothetical protein R6U98_07110, partial [Pirellulaceae bacterium]
MVGEERTVRIFISSPGDVEAEREKARQVIDDLQHQYTGMLRLEPVLWEGLPLPATASFQETIEYILHKHPIDVAVFILWSRLGTPLTDQVTRPDGQTYRSGTEREFDLMQEAYQQSGKQRPHILVYIRNDDSWKQRAVANPTADLRDMVEQQEAVKGFIREQFYDREQRNVGAYHTYPEPISLAERLAEHLRRHLDEQLDIEAASRRWTGRPYRGLHVFEQQHAEIFYGREEETHELMHRLRDQLAQQADGYVADHADPSSEKTCAFTLIVGASGSGKSSLARAGVAAKLVSSPYDEHEWRGLT